MDSFWYNVDNGEDSMADPELGQLQTQASGVGNWERTKTQNGTYYAGTNTKQEYLELEGQLRSLISQGMTFTYMRNYLISEGYQQKMIEQLFRQLTGMHHEDVVDVQIVSETPGTIPGVNYGWGECKKKEFDYCFVMPWNLGYALFGQKGDTHREEMEHFMTLAEARESLKKQVKNARFFDAPVDEKLKLNDTDKTGLREPATPYMGIKVASIEDLDRKLRAGEITPKQYAAIAQEAGFTSGDAFFDGLNRQADPNNSIDQVGEGGNLNIEQLTRDQVADLEQALTEVPVEDAVKPGTPMDLLKDRDDETASIMAPKILGKILNKLNGWNEDLQAFKLHTDSLQYRFLAMDERLDNNIPLETQRAVEYFSSSGVVTLVLNVEHLQLPKHVSTKKGLVVFSVIGDDIVINEVLKGTDKQEYAITDEGLAKYFQEELHSVSE